MKKQTFTKNNNEFENIINELITNDTVQEMKNFTQHFGTTRFDHCYSAAHYCYKICKKLHLDYKSATRAAMLHDLFLYDWKEQNLHFRFHAFNHGKTACENACRLFNMTKKEQDIITRHMWPVTLDFPTSIEGFILTFVDKYCAICESWQALKILAYSKKSFQYTYLLLGLIIFNLKQV